MNEPIHIFTVRERPVGFVPCRFGGALVAVERGHFPISNTGYRSLAGNFGLNGAVEPTEIQAEFLEAIAVAQDRTRTALLARLRRGPLPSSDRLSNFIGVSSDAGSALAEGFFAPEEDRFQLWRGAFRLLCLIDTDARFQPAPTAPAWTPTHCAKALARRRALIGLVRRLAAGELPVLPEETDFAIRAYLELPPKPAGEPPFDLPALTADLPPLTDFEDDSEASDDSEPEECEQIDEDSEQMSLL